MIDLHVHSTFSDGSDTVEEIIQKANELNINHLSITDHNRCEAFLRKNKKCLKNFKGKIITGTEISAYFDAQVLHVLAYGFNPRPINKFLNNRRISFKDVTKEEIKLIAAALDKLGIPYEMPDDTYNYEKQWSIRHFHKYICNEENCNKYFNGEKLTYNQLFWEHITNPNSPFFCDFSALRPTIIEVLTIVHKAGGKCFVAHSDIYGKHFPAKLDTLKNLGIDGLECYYPTYTPEYTEFLVKYCNDNNLYKSAGSDYHGKNREQNKLGTGQNNNLCIDESVIKDWFN